MTDTIGDRLIHIRGEISRAKFADLIGIHKNSLGNYERGERTPDAEVLLKFMQAGYNANWLITGEGPIRLDEIPTQSDSRATLYQKVIKELQALHETVEQTEQTSLSEEESRWLEWYRQIGPEGRVRIEPIVRDYAGREGKD